MEVYPNHASGIPRSPFASPSSAFSHITPAVAPSSGSASTSALPASTSKFAASSASLAQAPSASYADLPAGSHASARLCSLTEWSQQRIKSIFEAEKDDEAVLAIRNTFSDKVIASVNGIPLAREGIETLVLSMRNGSAAEKSQLRVTWKYCVDVPCDPTTNREGSFGGVYIIKGIKRMLPGALKPAEFERHKTVTVKIESTSPDFMTDSRKITNLVFVASDVKVDRQMNP